MNYLITIFSLLFLISCAPDIEQKQYVVPKLNVKAKQKNTFINTKSIDQYLQSKWFSYLQQQPKNINQLNNKTALDLINSLYQVGMSLNNNDLINTANQLKSTYNKQSSRFLKYKKSDSAYFKTLTYETSDLLSSEIDETIEFIQQQQDQIEFILTHQVEKYYPWPSPDSKITGVLENLEYFIFWFNYQMRNSDIDPNIIAAIQSSIVESYGLNLDKLKIKSQVLMKENNLSRSIQTVKDIINSIDTKLDTSSEKFLLVAENIGQSLDFKPTPHNVLKQIVKIWEQMDADTQNLTFGRVAPEFHQTLKNISPSNRKCLKQALCINLPYVALREILVLPELKKYGIQNLSKKIQLTGVQLIQDEISKQAYSFLKNIPKLVQQKINDEFTSLINKLINIKEHHEEYLTSQFKPWTKSQFKNEDLILEISAPQTSSSYTFAQSIKSDYYRLNYTTEKKEIFNLYLNQINKISMALGFKSAHAKQPSSLFVNTRVGALTRASKASSVVNTYLIPDKIKYYPQNPLKKHELDFSSENLAELISSFSLLASQLKPWEKSSFDDVMKPYKFSHVINDLPDEYLDYELFPKDILYATSIFTVSELIKSFSQEGSSLFLISTQGELVWANEFLDIKYQEKK